MEGRLNCTVLLSLCRGGDAHIKSGIGRGQKNQSAPPLFLFVRTWTPTKTVIHFTFTPSPPFLSQSVSEGFLSPKAVNGPAAKKIRKNIRKAKAFPGIAVRGNTCRAKSTKFVSTRQLVHCLFRKSPFLSPFYPPHSKLCTKLPLHPLNYKTGPIKLRRGGGEGLQGKKD